MEALLLRLDAPLMSFGGIVVDNLGVTSPMPGRSMLTGLLGNALGYRHSDDIALQQLQERILYAVRCDRAGQEIVDYQTVDLSQEFLGQGWTTRGTAEAREGGSSGGTHIRYRHYIADAIYTVALSLHPPDALPDIAALATALERPARPLFIGRKPCLPSAPLLLSVVTGTDLRSILQQAPPADDQRCSCAPWRAWWPDDGQFDESRERRISVHDDRDWTNQIHTGRRWLVEGTIDE